MIIYKDCLLHMIDIQLHGDSLLYRNYTEQEQKKTEKEWRYESGTQRVLSKNHFLSRTKLDVSPNQILDLTHALSLEWNAFSCIQCDRQYSV